MAAVLIERPANVRQAGPADETVVYDLLIALWTYNSRGWGFPYRPELVIRVIEQGTRPDPRTRSDPSDQRRGLIGVIDGDDGKLAAAVGIYLDPPVWFTDAMIPTELWVFVRPDARNARRLERDLARFAEWAHEKLRPGPDYRLPFPMATGFMHCGTPKRFHAMGRLWQRLFPSARPVGMLFWRD